MSNTPEKTELLDPIVYMVTLVLENILNNPETPCNTTVDSLPAVVTANRNHIGNISIFVNYKRSTDPRKKKGK